MNRDDARQEIRSSWKRLFTADNKKKGIVCPICGSGSGKNGTGITENPKKPGQLKCWACGFQGDAIDLIMQRDGSDYNTALKTAANDLGIVIDPYRESVEEMLETVNKSLQAAQERPRKAPESPGTGADDKKPGEAPKTAQEGRSVDYMAYYQQCWQRLDDPAAVSYLQARGISMETARACRVGYDPAADPSNAPGATGNEYKPHPVQRIILPTSRGHYVGRSIDPETPNNWRKLNPKGGSPGIFNGAALYAQEKQPIFVVEGAFDALSFVEIGERAIATNSKGNAAVLLSTLRDRKPTADTFIVVPDNDEKPETAAATLRQAQELCEGLQDLGLTAIVYNVAGEYHDANDALVQDREGFKQRATAAKQTAAGDYIAAFLEKIQTEAYKPYQTGLSFFDTLLGGGVIRQTLLLLLAAPGTGKTTLCQQIAEEMAIHGKPVIYINLEMAREQMIAKAISSRAARNGAQISALKVMQGYRWTEDERAAILAAAEEYRARVMPNLTYNPEGVGSDLDAIKTFLRRAGDRAKAAGQEAPAVVLDYLHLISSRGGLDTQELIKQSVTTLKDYAVDYDTFVIGIVATNRESNRGGRITMESGRDSSNLEYTADYQLSLNYYAIDQGEVKPTDIEEIAKLQQAKWRQMIIRVLKGRFCTPGKAARVYFNAECNLFYGENDWLPNDDEITPFDESPEYDLNNLELPANKKQSKKTVKMF